MLSILASHQPALHIAHGTNAVCTGTCAGLWAQRYRWKSHNPATFHSTAQRSQLGPALHCVSHCALHPKDCWSSCCANTNVRTVQLEWAQHASAGAVGGTHERMRTNVRRTGWEGMHVLCAFLLLLGGDPKRNFVPFLGSSSPAGQACLPRCC